MDKKDYKKTVLTKLEKKDRGDDVKKQQRPFDSDQVKALPFGGDADLADKSKVIVSKKRDDVKFKNAEPKLSKDKVPKRPDVVKMLFLGKDANDRTKANDSNVFATQKTEDLKLKITDNREPKENVPKYSNKVKVDVLDKKEWEKADKLKDVEFKKVDKGKTKILDRYIYKGPNRSSVAQVLTKDKLTKSDEAEVITNKKSIEVKLKIADDIIPSETVLTSSDKMQDFVEIKGAQSKYDKQNIVLKTSEDGKIKETKHDDKKPAILSKEERRKIRERYTIKLKNPVVTSLVNKDDNSQVNNLPLGDVKDDGHSKNPGNQKGHMDTSVKIEPFSKNTPIKKTLTSIPNNTRIPKAVTFQKKELTNLQVKLPNYDKSVKNLKTNDASVVKKASKVSARERAIRTRKIDRRKKRGRYIVSPNSDRVKSPPTEVAKWAPSSINKHTFPYYEAWVNTTLAAVSKSTSKDKMLIAKELRNFQKTLSKIPPEIDYDNYTDEKFTGKIRVKQRQSSIT